MTIARSRDQTDQTLLIIILVDNYNKQRRARRIIENEKYFYCTLHALTYDVYDVGPAGLEPVLKPARLARLELDAALRVILGTTS